MSNSIDSAEIKVALKNRLVGDWNTETAINMVTSSGKLVHAANFGGSSAPDIYRARTVGLGNFESDIFRTTENTNFNMEFDVSASNQGWGSVASFFGSVDSPTLLTSGQGDYRHRFDFESSSSGSTSIAWRIASNEVIEIPHVAWNSMSLTVPNASVGAVSLQGIADALLDNANATNTPTGIDSLSFPADFDAMSWTCSGYLRVGAFSTSVPLDSDDVQETLSVSLTLSRPLETRFVNRGSCASSRTQKPRTAGSNSGQLTFTLGKQDSAVFDAMGLWKNESDLMAELYIAGDAIGTGAQKSVKVQIPKMRIISSPQGLDASGGRDGLIEPVITCEILQNPNENSAGMSGVEFCRIEVVNSISGSYLS